MSGSGAPETAITDAADLSIVIVAGSWHSEVMAGLLAGAEGLCAEVGIEPEVIRVPGAFELPVVAAHVARDVDAVVALGVVIRGGTPHFDFVAQAATDGLLRVALDTGVPVGFGLLTCDSEEQALDRAGLAGSSENKGREAVHAALSTAQLLTKRRDARTPTGLGFGR